MAKSSFWKAAGISLAIALVFTGCDDVLGEIQKGLKEAETPAYSIVLSEEAYAFKSADTELALLVVNSGDEATGTLKAELTGEGREAFTLSKTELPSIAAGKSGKLVVKVVAELEAGVYKAAVVLSGEKGVAASLDVSYEVEEAEAEVVEETDTEEEAVAEEPEAVEETDTEEEAVAEEPAAVEETDTEEEAVAEEPEEEPKDEPKADEPKEDPKDEPKADEPPLPPEPPVPPPPVEPEPESDIEWWSYGISLNLTDDYRLNENDYYNFPLVLEGYDEYAPVTVTITNTLSQPTGPLTVRTADWFTLSSDTLQSIEAGGTATFTIAPKTGLSHGGYSDTLTISGDNGILAKFGIVFVIEGAGLHNPDIYLINLDLRGGMFADLKDHSYTLKVRRGFAIEQPADVFKPGYTFGGWYRDAAYKTLWNFADIVPTSMVLYAKWIVVE